LGNYAGAIRPAIQASTQPGVDAFFFLADYHALIKCDDPARVARSRLQIAATWLAAGLDPERVTFYRQSDIPEIPELCWLLSCVTAKGLMNRAHAYKACVDQNVAKGVDPDDGVSVGLFSYPVLMAADILIFNAHKVPVGRDQIQHLEMARDIAQRFNQQYGHPYFVLPEVVVEPGVAALPGLDGRKMSKSYNNTIALFEGGAHALRAAVMRIVTDSRAPGEPKDVEHSYLYPIYRAFSTPAESDALRTQLKDGLSWGEAKQIVWARLERDIAPMRARYVDLIAHPGRIEDILQAGAEKARKLASPMLRELRRAVGLPRLDEAGVSPQTSPARQQDKGAARWASFRDAQGHFRFILSGVHDEQLLLSHPFTDPKEAGRVMRRLQSEAPQAFIRLSGQRCVALLDGVEVADSAVPQGTEAQAWLEKVCAVLCALAQRQKPGAK
jgi:tryptophanyl-tRNA synthetase